MPSPTPATIYDRIARHSAASARLEASCDPANESAARNRGEKVTDAAVAEYDAACAAEIVRFDELLAHVPSSIVDLRRQIGYIRFQLECRDALDRDQLDLLFGALIRFRPREHA
jgi:hypothetical protein